MTSVGDSFRIETHDLNTREIPGLKCDSRNPFADSGWRSGLLLLMCTRLTGTTAE